ncbi:tRNA-specific 2-thiouridylase MnmA-like [Sycon ciliatum]|uniref:tRNA-specific 2-thiouridylase MnmA-like n=1 Tax=Sycon ciliatum TaxID=27933 RepID=UPI0031F62D4D
MTGRICSEARKRVAVALSGTKKSAVAARVLQERGYDVFGVHMLAWNEPDARGSYPGEKQWRAVQAISKHLGMECFQIDCVKHYWNNVFTPAIEGFSAGTNQNPDLMVNREIFFGSMLERCVKQYGADYLAIGTCAVVRIDPAGDGQQVQLLCPADSRMPDNAYWLSQIPQLAMQRALLPLGNMSLDDIEKVFVESGLSNVTIGHKTRGFANIGAHNFRALMSEYIGDRPGPVALLDGKVVGAHYGVHYFTEGQAIRFAWRSKWPRPKVSSRYFVSRRDASTRTLFVADGYENPAFYSEDLIVRNLHWISGEPPAGLSKDRPITLSIKNRHSNDPITARVLECPKSVAGNQRLLMTVSTAIRGVNPGQICSIYDGDVCLGGGPIHSCLTQSPKQPPLVPDALPRPVSLFDE